MKYKALSLIFSLFQYFIAQYIYILIIILIRLLKFQIKKKLIDKLFIIIFLNNVICKYKNDLEEFGFAFNYNINVIDIQF